jgi:hypothetical protein
MGEMLWWWSAGEASKLMVFGTYVFLERVEDEILELLQAVVDALPSFFLHNWLVALQS